MTVGGPVGGSVAAVGGSVVAVARASVTHSMGISICFRISIGLRVSYRACCSQGD